MRVATWNVNSLKVRLAHLLDWLRDAQPDVACLQETKTEDANFPVAELRAAGYESVFCGQKGYNGVAILSRSPIADVAHGIPDFADDPKRCIHATIGGVRVVCLYAPNGEAPGKILGAKAADAVPREIPIPPEEARPWTAEADFIRAVREGRPASPSFEDGLKYMAMTEAIFRSALLNQPTL